MKTILIALLSALPVFVSAEALQVTVKLLDRADTGAPIRGLYVYPSAVLESGETGSMHIGRELRFPVGTQTVDLGEGVSKQETIYEEAPVGFIFSLTYTLEGGIIDYTAKGVSKVSLGTSGETTLTSSKEIIFYGKSELGGIVEAQFNGPDGTIEDISIHFGPAPDEE